MSLAVGWRGRQEQTMFSLRTLFLVIAGVALFCGGWAICQHYDSRHELRLLMRNKALLRDIDAHEARIEKLMLALKMCEDR
jgi:hypothetical protein